MKKNRELLLDFLKFHYKENQFRKQSTNEKDVDSYFDSLVIKWEDLVEGDEYELNQDGEWVKGKICRSCVHGSRMIEVMEGTRIGKQWHLFPDLKTIRK